MTGSSSLKAGDKVQLTGFGTFEVKERGARVGRNPKTKEAIEIPACRMPAFKAGKILKDAIRLSLCFPTLSSGDYVTSSPRTCL